MIPGGFLNISGRRVPKELQILLSFGPKYSPIKVPNINDYFVALNSYNEIHQEQCIILDYQSPLEMQKQFSQFLEIMTKYQKPNRTHQILFQMYAYASEYIKKQKDLIIVQADKGHSTYQNLEKGSYVLFSGNQQALFNRLTAHFRRIVRPLCQWHEKEPTSFPKNILLSLQRMISNCNPTFFMLKLHKPDQPLRPICSPLNWYIHPLHQLVQHVLKETLSDRMSKHNLKNMSYLTGYLISLQPLPDYVFMSMVIKDMYPSTNVASLWRTLKNLMCLPWFLESCPIPILMLTMALEYILNIRNYFTFENKCYLQTEGLPQRGAASGPLATIYLDSQIEIHTPALFHQHKIHSWWKYVDDVLLYISQHDIPSFVETFQELVGYDVTYEVESANPNFNNYPTISYLDYNIIHTPTGYLMSLYYKKQQSMRMLHYTSHISYQVKKSTILYYLHRVIYRTSLEYLEHDLYNCITQILINGYPYVMVQEILYHLLNTYMHQNSKYIQKPTYARYLILQKYLPATNYPGLHDKHPRPRRYRRSLVYSCDEISKVLTQTTNTFQDIMQPFTRSETLFTLLNMSLRSISSTSSSVTP
ncbi:uncharacterized protein LOC119688441 [Teleopsis dalmanni]|uniref:uncharacterized protein LOC119688441 n=1 Tax=Teleopsis dalmanni TaxID=139649 RepID=UPI0018CE4509|nr:uncharacterized protein LOC119688441 [Teleopsis dalmanni]